MKHLTQRMTHKMKFLPNAVFAAISLFAFSLSTAEAQQQSNVVLSGWVKTCNEDGKNKLCNVQYNVASKQGNQVITAVNLIEISGDVNRKIFRIIVPTGRSLPEGVEVKVDNNRAVNIPYTYCRPQICAAEAQLNDELIKIFKAGGALEITSLNFQDKPNPVPVTLKGFTAAYDGPATKQETQLSREEQIKKQLEDKLKSE